MSEPPHRLARHEDLYGVPEHMVGEIIDGELLMSPRPRARHAMATARLGADLIALLDPPSGAGGPGGWIFLDEPELHLGGFTGRRRARDEALVPDIAGWRRARMPRVPDVAGFELPPDWVCEVLSRSTEAIDRVKKMRVYAAAGVEWLWLLAPEPRILEVYQLSGEIYGRVAGHAGSGRVHVPPFDAVELHLGRWWLDDEAEPDAEGRGPGDEGPG